MTLRTLALTLTPERIERFRSKVEPGPTDQCWEWKGERHSAGYGVYSEWSGNRRSLRLLAHRVSLAIAGEDVAGWVVRHDCDNPPCVNPSHLRLGTQADNNRDAVERNRVDTSGLAIGQSGTWPPRPCRRCGVIVSQGRKRYCPPCRELVTHESHARYRERKRGLSERERRKLKKKAS